MASKREELIMRCPACNRELTVKRIGAIQVDVCEGGCGGLWFDQLELQRFDEEYEPVAGELFEIAIDQDVHVDRDQRRRCPKCADIVMMRFYYSPRREVQVDHCPNCGGHWLDAGELAAIRGLYGHPEGRRIHMDEVIDEHFGEQIVGLEGSRREPAKVSLWRVFKFATSC